MANFQGKDASGTPQYFKASGSGASGDPFIPEHTISGTVPVTDNGGSLTVDDGGTTLSIDDGGGSLTVDGTVTANLSSSTNAGATAKTLDYDSGAGTDTVTGFGVLIPKSGGAVAGGTSSDPLRVDPTGTTTQPVSAASLPLPTGAATAAKQPALGTAGSASADVITVQGIASMTALKVDGSAVTQPVSDGGGSLTVDGSVSIGSALPAGTNYIGKTRLTDGTNDVTLKSLTNAKAVPTAIVDGNGDQITSFGGGVQYTEGDVDATITGTAALWEDSGNTLTTVSAAKPLPVNIISGAGSGGTAIQDDSAFTVGTSNLTPAGGTYKSTRDSVDDGDAGAFAMTATRALYTSIETPNGDSAMDDTNDAVRVNLVTGAALPVTDNGSTLSIDDGGGSVTVDGTVAISGTVAVTDNSGSLTVDNGGTFAVQESGAALTSLQLIDDAIVADNAGFTDGTTKLDMAGYIFDEVAGTALTENDAAAARIDSKRAQVMVVEDATTRGRRQTVSAGGAALVDAQQSGTWTVQPGNTANTTAWKVDNSAVNQPTVGNVAHDGVDSGNPVKQGFKAINAEVTAVANADRVDGVADLTGKQIVLPYANPENFIAGKTSDITGTSDTAVIAAQGAGLRIYVTQIIVTNSHASVNTWVNIKDGATTIYTGYAYSAGGGFVINFPVPLRLTANTALNAACETTGSNVRVSASGYKGA